MKIKPLFAWYDLWIGVFWDRSRRRLYVLPIPCVGFVIEFARPELVEVFRGVTHALGLAPQNCSIVIDTRKPPTAFVNRWPAPTGSKFFDPPEPRLTAPIARSERVP